MVTILYQGYSVFGTPKKSNIVFFYGPQSRLLTSVLNDVV